MKMDIVAGSKNDEFYTPEYAIIPLLKYLKKNTVWCPFDTVKSNFVKIFKENGFKVFHSHIKEGNDFFKYKPKFDYDYIISNPPFSSVYICQGILPKQILFEEISKKVIKWKKK